MSKKRNSIVEAVTDPTKNFLATFLVGTILFNLIADGLSEIFWGTLSQWLQTQLHITDKNQLQGYILAILITIVLLLIYSTNATQWLRSRLTRWSLFGTQVPDRATIAPLTHPRRGLIVLMSPKADSPAEAAIRYHWNQGQTPCLEHCWIICTETSLPHARAMKQHLLATGLDEHHTHLYYGQYALDDPSHPDLNLIVGDRAVNNPNVILTLINAIYADAQTKGLDESDILVDFTGGTKPMSVGTVLACADPSRHLQYLTQTNPPEIVEVKVSYKIKPLQRSQGS